MSAVGNNGGVRYPRRQLTIALNACGGRGEDRHAAKSARPCSGGGAGNGCRRIAAGGGAKIGRHPQDSGPRQPGEHVDATLDAVDTTQWYPKVIRKDYAVGLTVSENGLDDPDQQFYENFVCGAERNYTGYCNHEVDALVDRQSMEADLENRKQLVWGIERKLAEDIARPVIFYPVSGACWQPYFKGHTMMVNGNYNGWRLEDAWLDK
jgi:ABC-type transport system substrate-binding protein